MWSKSKCKTTVNICVAWTCTLLPSDVWNHFICFKNNNNKKKVSKYLNKWTYSFFQRVQPEQWCHRMLPRVRIWPNITPGWWCQLKSTPPTLSSPTPGEFPALRRVVENLLRATCHRLSDGKLHFWRNALALRCWGTSSYSLQTAKSDAITWEVLQRKQVIRTVSSFIHLHKNTAAR